MRTPFTFSVRNCPAPILRHSFRRLDRTQTRSMPKTRITGTLGERSFTETDQKRTALCAPCENYNDTFPVCGTDTGHLVMHSEDGKRMTRKDMQLAYPDLVPFKLWAF